LALDGWIMAGFDWVIRAGESYCRITDYLVYAAYYISYRYFGRKDAKSFRFDATFAWFTRDETALSITGNNCVSFVFNRSSHAPMTFTTSAACTTLPWLGVFGCYVRTIPLAHLSPSHIIP